MDDFQITRYAPAADVGRNRRDTPPVLHGDRIAAIMVCDELEQRLLQDAAMFERYYRLEMQSAESLHR